MELVFYVLLLLLIIPGVCYLALWIFPGRRSVPTGLLKPTRASVILPMYNEEFYAARKIRELVKECSASFSEFEIIIVSDGSKDRTNEIIRENRVENIRTLILGKRLGKANALNEGVRMAKYDLLVFCDTRQKITAGSLAKLTNHFSDNTVGAVSARLDHQEPSRIRKAINFLKTQENKSGSTIGVYGALYAIRKSCYVAIPPDTILDDLLISLQVLRQKKRVLLEPEAVTVDVNIYTFYSGKRTSRIVSGLLQLAGKHIHLIRKLPLGSILLLYSQKYFKLILPFLIIMISVFSYILGGPSSIRFQCSAILILLLIVFLLLNGVKRIRFASLVLAFYTMGLFGRKQTVFWDKL